MRFFLWLTLSKVEAVLIKILSCYLSFRILEWGIVSCHGVTRLHLKFEFVDYGVPGLCHCCLKFWCWLSDDGNEGDDDCTDDHSAGEPEEIDTKLDTKDVELFAELTKVLRGVYGLFR